MAVYKCFSGKYSILILHAMFFTGNRLVVMLFLLMLAGSVVFTLERMLFVDASLILTRIINYGSFQIQEHRYGSFITQAFPLIASKLNMPLFGVLLVYSISFQIFYLAVALVLILKFKQPSLAILMAFYHVLFVSDTWFWTNNEVHQGIAWMFLFFGYVNYMHEKNASFTWLVPGFCIIGFLAIFTHPLVIFPLAFLWLFYMINKRWKNKNRQFAVLSIILTAITIIKFRISTTPGKSYYDIEKLENISTISFQKITQALQSPLALEIYERCLTNYWLVLIILLAGIVSACNQRKFLPLVLTLLFTAGYLIAICITFHDFIPFYMESELMPLSIITSSLFVFYTLPMLNKRNIAWLIMSIFIIRLIYIGISAPKWIERKEWILTTLGEMREKEITKAVVPETEAINRTLVMNWGVPMESLIASSLAGDKPPISFVVDKTEALKERMNIRNNQLIGTHTIMDFNLMNPSYFSFDTVGSYRFFYK